MNQEVFQYHKYLLKRIKLCGVIDAFIPPILDKLFAF